MDQLWEQLEGLQSRLAALADRPGDTPEERLQGLYLIYLALAMSTGALGWALLALLYGRLGVASVPLAFLIVTGFNTARFVLGGSQQAAWQVQLWLGVLLPFLCHLLGGGVIGTAGVLVWALPAVVAASEFAADAGRTLVRGTLGILALVPVVALVPVEPLLPDWLVPLTFSLNLAGALTAAYFLGVWLSDARRRVVRRLEDIDSLRTDFLSTVSHELRTPLTSILGFNEMNKKKLEKSVFPKVVGTDAKTDRAVQQVRGNIKVIVTEGRRLTDLVNNVLDLHKMESGMMTWNRADNQVCDLVGHAGAACSVLFMDKMGVRYVEDLDEGLPHLHVDGDRIIQVLINLLTNAIKFTEEGEVGVRARRVTDGVELCIFDTGPGIAPDDLDAVFDHFRQVGEADEKVMGSGLGLSISKKIVEGHGGQIWAESRLGEGSQFYLRLPVEPV